MWFAMVLLAASYIPANHFKSKLRHPMTLSVKVWALGHLLSNGNLVDVVLFGGFLLWSVLVFRAARKRDRMSLHSAPEGKLLGTVLSVLVGTGVWAALGTLAALFQRHTTGKGCVVDTSLLETALGWLGVLMAGFSATGEQPVRHRTGNPRVVVFQAFEASDGEIVVAAANDRLFVKLCNELGRPDWASDERFASNALRFKHKPDILPEMAAIFATQTVAQWVERLEAAGVPCSPIHDFKQVREQPQTQALGIFQDIPEIDLRVVGLPVSFNGVRPPVGHRAPHIGEHSALFGAPVPKSTANKKDES
jgi:crotonobetainyl-CoA:carnitine CoA-transferase CaiB-like acyl-CoA transferase